MTKPDTEDQPAEGSPEIPPPQEGSPGTEAGRDQPGKDAAVPESIDGETRRDTP